MPLPTTTTHRQTIQRPTKAPPSVGCSFTTRASAATKASPALPAIVRSSASQIPMLEAKVSKVDSLGDTRWLSATPHSINLENSSGTSEPPLWKIRCSSPSKTRLKWASLFQSWKPSYPRRASTLRSFKRPSAIRQSTRNVSPRPWLSSSEVSSAQIPVMTEQGHESPMFSMTFRL